MYWGNMGLSPVLRLRQIHTFERSSPLPIIPNPNHWTLGHVYKPEFPTQNLWCWEIGNNDLMAPIGISGCSICCCCWFSFFFFFWVPTIWKVRKSLWDSYNSNLLSLFRSNEEEDSRTPPRNIFLENLQILWILRIPINEHGISDWNSGIFRDSEFLSKVLSMQLCWWK